MQKIETTRAIWLEIWGDLEVDLIRGALSIFLQSSWLCFTQAGNRVLDHWRVQWPPKKEPPAAFSRVSLAPVGSVLKAEENLVLITVILGSWPIHWWEDGNTRIDWDEPGCTCNLPLIGDQVESTHWLWVLAPPPPQALRTLPRDQKSIQFCWGTSDGVGNITWQFQALEQCMQKSLVGLLWCVTGNESACQCRRHGFSPWSRKIPHAEGH